MKTESKFCIWAAGVAVVLAIAVVCFFSKNTPPEQCTNLSLFFLGICRLFIVLALISITALMLWQWGKITAHQTEEEKKRTERIYSEARMAGLRSEAQIRRDIEHERNRITDLFRLIELAKEKSEEITDKTITKDKGEVPKLIRNNYFTKKNELTHPDILAKLVDHYNALSTTQQTKTP